MKETSFTRVFDVALVCLSGYLMSQLVPWLAAETPIREVRADVFFLGVSISILVLRVADSLKRRLQRNLENTRRIVWVNRERQEVDLDIAGEHASRNESIMFADIHSPQRMFAPVETLAELESGEGS
jgi:hypothetical protein